MSGLRRLLSFILRDMTASSWPLTSPTAPSFGPLAPNRSLRRCESVHMHSTSCHWSLGDFPFMSLRLWSHTSSPTWQAAGFGTGLFRGFIQSLARFRCWQMYSWMSLTSHCSFHVIDSGSPLVRGVPQTGRSRAGGVVF